MSTNFSETVARAWHNEQLIAALFELTFHCNLDCQFCYNDRALSGRPLDKDDYDRILAELAELNCLMLTLSGGEPLSSPYFFYIGARAKQNGFSLRIKTNGHSVTEPIARRILGEMRPSLVEVSLHGNTAITHDAQTQKSGSFKRLIANLKTMKRIGLPLRLNSTVTRLNEDELQDMYSLADQLAIPLRFDPEVTAKDDGDQSPLSLAASPAGLARLRNIQAARIPKDIGPDGAKGQTPTTDRHCGAGSSSLVIDPFGTVYPCVQWRNRLGNVHDASLKTIWRGPEITATRSDSKQVKRWLNKLPTDQRPKQYCPGVAQQQTGKIMTIYSKPESRNRVFDPDSMHLRVVS